MLEAHQTILMNQQNNWGRKTTEHYTIRKKTTERTNASIHCVWIQSLFVMGANKVRNEYYLKRFQYIVWNTNYFSVLTQVRWVAKLLNVASLDCKIPYSNLDVH